MHEFNDDEAFSPEALLLPDGRVFLAADDVEKYLKLCGLPDVASEISLCTSLIAMDVEVEKMLCPDHSSGTETH